MQGGAASLSQLEQRNQKIEAQMHRRTGAGSAPIHKRPGATAAVGPLGAQAGFHMVYSGVPEMRFDGSANVAGGVGSTVPVELSASHANITASRSDTGGTFGRETIAPTASSGRSLATQPRSARADVERSATVYRLEQMASMHESALLSPAGGRPAALG